MNKLYKISENSPLKHLDILLFDYLLLAVAYTFAYYVKFWDMGFITTDKWRAYFSIQCLVNFAVVVITGSYRGILQRTASEELIKTGQHAIYNFMITSIMFYVLKLGEAYSRTTSILLPVFFCSLSFIMRCLYKKAFRNDRKALFVEENSIFVIGKSKDIPKLIRSINSGFFKEYSIKGLCVVDAPLGEVFSSEIDVVKSSGKVEKERLEFKNEVAVEDVLRYVLKHKINEVFIGVEPSVLTSETYKAFVDNGKGIHLDIESMIGITSDSQLITTIGTNSTVSIGFHQFTGKQLIYLVIKRIIDVVSSLLVMILFVPVALVIKIAFMITGDFGSVFYAQNRIGMNGKPFRLFKIRTMVRNSAEMLEELLKDGKYRAEWEANQKFEDDPRITKVGKFLRKTSLDEMPQFINVFKGEMSLVGPRPLVEGELESHGGLQLYYQLRPGITGWWGCNGRSNTTYAERLELEYYYIRNCSLYLDTLCIFKTIGAILTTEGAE